MPLIKQAGQARRSSVGFRCGLLAGRLMRRRCGRPYGRG
jgi:hypothetical protein